MKLSDELFDEARRMQRGETLFISSEQVAIQSRRARDLEARVADLEARDPHTFAIVDLSKVDDEQESSQPENLLAPGAGEEEVPVMEQVQRDRVGRSVMVRCEAGVVRMMRMRNGDVAIAMDNELTDNRMDFSYAEAEQLYLWLRDQYNSPGQPAEPEKQSDTCDKQNPFNKEWQQLCTMEVDHQDDGWHCTVGVSWHEDGTSRPGPFPQMTPRIRELMGYDKPSGMRSAEEVGEDDAVQDMLESFVDRGMPQDMLDEQIEKTEKREHLICNECSLHSVECSCNPMEEAIVGPLCTGHGKHVSARLGELKHAQRETETHQGAKMHIDPPVITGSVRSINDDEVQEIPDEQIAAAEVGEELGSKTLLRAAKLMKDRAAFDLHAGFGPDTCSTVPHHSTGWDAAREGDGNVVTIRNKECGGPPIFHQVYTVMSEAADHIASWPPIMALAVAELLLREITTAEDREAVHDREVSHGFLSSDWKVYYPQSTRSAIEVALTYLRASTPIIQTSILPGRNSESGHM